MKILLLLTLMTLFSFGREITIDEIEGYPKGYARDFYIWQFLQQEDVPHDEKEQAYKLVHKQSWRIDKYFPEHNQKCKTKISELPKSCISPRFLSTTSSDNLRSLLKKYIKKDDRIEYLTKAFYYSQSMEKTLFNHPELYLDIFNKLSPEKRKDERIDTKLSQSFLKKLEKFDKKFERFVSLVLAYGHFHKIKSSFLQMKPSRNMTAKTLFRLSYFYIQKGKIEKAFESLKVAGEVAYYQEHRDQARFWLYLLSKDEKYLNQLIESWDINIYTLYAHEKKGIEIDGYVSGVELHEKKKTNLNSSDPFQWQSFLLSIKDKNSEDLLKLAEKFKNKKQWEIYYYLVQRGNRFRKQSFPTEFEEYLVGVPADLKAILYAISRQESRFIPSVVSLAYALGSMQMMPFLVKDIAKQRGEEVDLEEMFEFKKSVTYSIHHLKDLRRQFKHPLFIAYAYNGGSGYARRVKKQKFKAGDFEPFLSLETLTYGETRKYGKKVLANYVIYKKLLGEKITIHELLEKL
jgi:soluble lytic murein transglycosylase